MGMMGCHHQMRMLAKIRGIVGHQEFPSGCQELFIAKLINAEILVGFPHSIGINIH
jgi:hypothetical protein